MDRIRRLSSSSLLHIPVQFRARLCTITARLLTEMTEGNARSAALEEARTKLLLGPVPRKRNRRVELNTRLRLWNQGDFDTLLIRAEGQALDRQAHQRRRPGRDKGKGARSRLLAKEGAYGKGVRSLTSEVAAFSQHDELQWSNTLLPQSGSSHSAVFSQVASDVHMRDEDVDSQPRHLRSSMSGIRFPALSAAGPSGARPEHLKEMLAIRQRCVANSLYKAVAQMRSAGESGSLPDSARWILDSRLVFLKN